MSKPPPPKPPRPSQHKTREEATEEFRSCLESFLRIHNPDKLDNMEIILDGYHGEEVTLVNDLHSKYASEMSGSETREFLYLAGALQKYTKEDEEYTAHKEGPAANTAMAYYENYPPKITKRRKPRPPPGPPPGAAPIKDEEEEEEEDGVPKEAPPAVPSQGPPKPPKPPKPARTKEADTSNPFNQDDDDDDSDDDDEGEDDDPDAYKRRTIHSYRSKLKESKIIREGELTKLRAKDGSEEKHFFVLKVDSLDYIKDHSGNFGNRAKNDMQLLVSNMTGMSMGTEHLEEDLTRSIDLNDVLVMPLSASGARAGAALGSPLGKPPGRVSITCTNVVASVPDDGLTFRLFTKQKSFFLKANDRADRDAWMAVLKETSEKIQHEKRGKLLEPYEVAPIRVIATTKKACMVCDKEFRGMLGMLNSRHHHCRACGAVVCDSCSREKARIPSLDERALFKCCISCAKELKAGRTYGARRRSII